MINPAPRVINPSPGESLDELLASRFLPNHSARRIWFAQELPEKLRRREALLPPGSEWRAYRDDDRIFFTIARVHAPATRGDSLMALDVYSLDRDAAVYSAAVWVNDPKQGWWLDAVLDGSYDCDEGWWFDAPAGPQARL